MWRGIKTSATIHMSECAHIHVSEFREDALAPYKSFKMATLANSLIAILLEPELFSYIYVSLSDSLPSDKYGKVTAYHL